jgi:hypothetical protein
MYEMRLNDENRKGRLACSLYTLIVRIFPSHSTHIPEIDGCSTLHLTYQELDLERVIRQYCPPWTPIAPFRHLMTRLSYCRLRLRLSLLGSK